MEATRKVYSVSQLNRASKRQLEQHFGLVWLQGEISNLSMPSSGHWYFSLKDEGAQIRCAMFRGSNRFLNVKPQQGQQVLVRAKVTLYEPRGDYQLNVEYLEDAGTGNLQLAFEQLKQKLAQQGLFALEHKKPIPQHIARVAVVTSATGAALQDILSVLKRRNPSIEVTIYPCQVQGNQAADTIIHGLAKANSRAKDDIVILARGGGSLEDLWCFNDERLARAIYQSHLPVISAVGHEVDFTIADFVADERAPTPSAAAERVSSDLSQVNRELAQIQKRLTLYLERHLNTLLQRVDIAERSLRNPVDELQKQQLRFEQLHQRLRSNISAQLTRERNMLSRLNNALRTQSPVKTIENNNQRLSQLTDKLVNHCKHQLETQSNTLQINLAKLNTVSPLATLQRGYSITKDKESKILKDSKQVQPGDRLTTTLANGEIESIVC